MDYPRKFGWSLVDEPKPSLCKHYLPGGIHSHAPSIKCWCNPRVQNEPALNPPYSIAHHN